MIAADDHIAYVLLATRRGQIGLVDDKIYADLGQVQDLAVRFQAEEDDPTVLYSVGAVVALDR